MVISTFADNGIGRLAASYNPDAKPLSQVPDLQEPAQLALAGRRDCRWGWQV